VKIICSCCDKQAVNENVSTTDKYRTTLIGAVADVRPGTCICGHCAKDLDKNGLFPEEREYPDPTPEQQIQIQRNWIKLLT
jgi:hypothetical protein